jgi:thiol-disulfide isomerase/thioredoxin
LSKPAGQTLSEAVRALLPALIAVVLLPGCGGNKQANSDATPVLSAPPNTALPLPPANANAELGWVLNDGSRARISNYQGKVLVLDFYATWCIPCRQSIPRLIVLQQKFETRGLQVVGLNVGGPDDRVKVGSFAKELGINYQLGFPDRALTDVLLSGDLSIPQTVIFGRDGRIVKRFIGYDQVIENEVEKVIVETVMKN